MRIRILFVGKTARGPVADLLSEYVDRTQRFATIELVVVPEAVGADPSRQRETESTRLIAALQPGERVIVLDETGVQLSTVAFANRIGTWRDQGVRQLAILVGGAYGLNDAVRQRADLVLGLSSMTFPHQLVRVILAEQLYRAFTVLNRLPYHH
ncbi:MAG: 23S rRNA (pseudouridine(1915)-N(3))-methyltransferase RlmH [Flavobacteriales bacterium]|nr:23S rRNA (pseudouridine(1915)-N(3))-methyltransferase RlmH [Flavobacteriales bacterium]MCC6937378.1 23S rRNA (pseudouridine(1915)-N(3))-methyltransferase RlmH [Flavobacteriales bacterium]